METTSLGLSINRFASERKKITFAKIITLIHK